MSELKKCEVCQKECKNLGVHMKMHNKVSVSKPETNLVEQKLDSVISGLNTVAGALSKLVEMQTKPKEPEVKMPTEKPNFVAHLEDSTYPNAYIPPKFREIVNNILSPEFKINIVDFADRTDFLFEVIVPEKFSSVTKEDRAKGVQDVRSRMIPRALGENGVREWCELVRRNLNKFYQKEGVVSPFQEQLK